MAGVKVKLKRFHVGKNFKQAVMQSTQPVPHPGKQAAATILLTAMIFLSTVVSIYRAVSSYIW